MNEEDSILASQSSQPAIPSLSSEPQNIPKIPTRSSRYKLSVIIGISALIILLVGGVLGYKIFGQETRNKTANQLVEASILPSPSLASQEVTLATPETKIMPTWQLTSQHEVEVWDAKDKSHPPRISWEPKDTRLQKIEVMSYQDCHNVQGGDIVPVYDQDVPESWGLFTAAGVWEMNPQLVGFLGDHGIYFLRVTTTDGSWHISEKPIYTIIDEPLTPQRIAEIQKSLADCVFTDSISNQQAYKEYLEYWEKEKSKSSPSASAVPSKPEQDKRIKAYLGQLRILGEVYYDGNSASYTGLDHCFTTPSSANCKSSMESDVADILSILAKISGSSTDLATNANAQSFCISHKLTATEEYACIDSNGQLVQSPTATCGTATQCPK